MKTWTFNATGSGRIGTIQQWVVPISGMYRIEARGAQGGLNSSNQPGAPGARMSGDFYLVAGEKLNILVGQQGEKSPNANSSSGGGGTFVAINGVPLIVAGGGGGRGGNGSEPGVPGSIGPDGTLDSRGFGEPGRNGDGGISGSTSNANGGGGGAGFFGDGKPKKSNSGYPGISFLNGGAGGSSRDGRSYGGFGGGGGNHETSGGGGGGGGYSGGSGGQYNGSYGGGGGGGSYNAGTNQDNAPGVNYGDGIVTIKWISTAGFKTRQMHFGYTGSPQYWTAPYTGFYRLECWGARGGQAKNGGRPGYGGYSSGQIFLTKGEKLYIYVGGEGRAAQTTSYEDIPGGWMEGVRLLIILPLATLAVAPVVAVLPI